jgi:DnaK suppressor protein
MKKANGPAIGMENHRNLLLVKRSELLSGFRSQRDILVGPGAAPPEDLSPAFQDQFVAIQLSRLNSLELKTLDDALSRVNSEDYAVCVDCGGAISRRRLEAIPWATRCIACQEHFIS